MLDIELPFETHVVGTVELAPDLNYTRVCKGFLRAEDS